MADRSAFRVRPIDDRAFWTSLTDDARRRSIDAELRDVDAIPDELRLPSAADYVAASRSNDRARLDDHWRRTRPRLAHLALRRLLSGIDPTDRDDRLLNWTFGLTFEPTWVVSAHLPGKDLPRSGKGQWDLAACEMAAELAELREALSPWMATASGTIAGSIVSEIDRRVLAPLLVDDVHWAKPDARRLSNWSGVCGGSVLAACLSLEAQGLPRPECRDLMIRVLRQYFAVGFGASGECDEGIGYWGYGIDFACLGLSRMTPAALADAFDLRRVAEVAGYPGRCHLTGDVFFAGNDSEPRASCPQSGAWLGELVDSDFLRWWYAATPLPGVRTIPHLLRFLARDPSTRIAGERPTHDANRFLPDQQAALFQRPTPRGLFTFTVSGGTNDELHNHNDLGTFQVYLDERAIIPDLGAPHYVSDFFQMPARYEKYMVAASSGHCCPAINGVEQRPGAAAAGGLIAWREGTGELALDLTAAYPPAARLKRWTRTAHVPDDDALVVMNDEFVLDGGGEVVHRIWFVDEPTLGDGGATIASAKNEVAITTEPRPTRAEVLPFKAGDGRLMLRGWKAEHVLYRVDLTYRVAGGPLVVKTTIRVA